MSKEKGIMQWGKVAISIYKKFHNEKFAHSDLFYLPELDNISSARDPKGKVKACIARMQEHTSPENPILLNNVTRTKPYVFEQLVDKTWRLTEEGITYAEDLLLNSNKYTEKKDNSIEAIESTHGKIDEDYLPKTEGQKKVIQSIRYERNPKNRALALEYHGIICLACGFNFNESYGKDLAKNFIEVHHIKPISEGRIEIDPKKDLIPLCSNCHSMIHREKSMLQSFSEIINRYKGE